MPRTKSKKAAKKPARGIKRRKNGQFAPGNKGGRPKGVKNKKPAILVDKILDIEEKLAKEKKGLLDCARQDPKWFFEKLLAKILPKPVDVRGDIDHEIKISWLK